MEAILKKKKLLLIVVVLMCFQITSCGKADIPDKQFVEEIPVTSTENTTIQESSNQESDLEEIEDIKFRARSKMTKLKGKKAIKVYWNSPEGMEFDGFDVYRSIKKNKGYGKKPFYTSKANYYINNKDLKTGNTYYYKVRGFKYVNDEKVYTQWSWKAWRTVK